MQGLPQYSRNYALTYTREAFYNKTQIIGESCHSFFPSRLQWYNQNNLKRSIDNEFIKISTHVYVKNQNYNTKIYSILNSAKSLKMKYQHIHIDKNKIIEHPN